MRRLRLKSRLTRPNKSQSDGGGRLATAAAYHSSLALMERCGQWFPAVTPARLCSSPSGPPGSLIFAAPFAIPWRGFQRLPTKSLPQPAAARSRPLHCLPLVPLPASLRWYSELAIRLLSPGSVMLGSRCIANHRTKDRFAVTPITNRLKRLKWAHRCCQEIQS
jgi:hypothetical protein